MARPTINFTSGTLITADGNYYFEVQPGVPYSIVGHGDFGGGTLNFLVYDPAKDATYAVEGGQWSAAFEDGFTSPFAVMRIEFVGGIAPSVAVTFCPIKQQVHDT
jgi:hypothetical protein